MVSSSAISLLTILQLSSSTGSPENQRRLSLVRKSNNRLNNLKNTPTDNISNFRDLYNGFLDFPVNNIDTRERIFLPS